MRVFKKIICGILSIIFCSSIYGRSSENIHFETIGSFEEVIEKIPQEALILFDIDDTLITSPDVFARGNALPWDFRIKLLFVCPKLIVPHYWEKVYSLMWSLAPRTLIEPNIVETISHLQEERHVIIGLTSIETGSYGVISNFPEWRVKMLKGMGITFSDRFADQTYRHLRAYRGNYPEYYQGIICTNQRPKGEVLAAFLDSTNYKPDSIVFFDDDTEPLKTVLKVCQDRNISCSLFQYTRAKNLAGSWNSHKAITQIKYLIEKEEWIGDDLIE